MKRKLMLIAVVLLLGLTNVKAQDLFSKGAIAVNASIGLGNYSGYNMGIPPLSLSADVGVIDNLIGDNGSVGVGGYVGFATNSYTYNYYSNYYYKATVTRMCFGVRGTFHYQLNDKLDTYAGLMLGLYTYSYSYKDNYNDDYYKNYYSNLNHSDIAFSAYVGTRYYFSRTMALNAEVGYGFTYISAGLTFKLR